MTEETTLSPAMQPRPAPPLPVQNRVTVFGELTRVLHRHLQASETMGIDSSEAMLARSAAFAGDGLRFRQGDLRDFAVDENLGDHTDHAS